MAEQNVQKNESSENHFSGHLGGAVGSVSNFGSGHGLAVRGFKSCIVLCADSSEPGACFGFCVSLSLSLCPFPTHAVSLLSLKINKEINIKKKLVAEVY